MADEAEIDVVIRAKKEGTEAFLAVKEELRSIKESLKELQRQAEEANKSLGQIAASTAATAAAAEALNLATKNSTSSTNSNTSATNAATQATNAAAASGSRWVNILFGVSLALGPVLALLIALTPILVQFAGYVYVTTVYLIGAITVVAAFAAGLAATAGILALTLGAFGALGVAVVLLTERFAQAGKVMADPLLGLEKNLSRMADTWGRQAAPMAREIIKWLDDMVPRISRAGSELLKWFGEQLPAVLRFATGVINILTDAWDKLRPVLQPILEMVVEHAPEWLVFFQTIANIGVGAVNGLLEAFVRLSAWFSQRLPTMQPIVEHVMTRLGDAFDGLTTNLGRLSDWFIDRLPRMEPIANEALGKTGEVIQGLAKAAGDLVDWFINNWPTISEEAKEAFKAIKDGWESVKPALMVLLPAALLAFNIAMDEVKHHSQLAHDTLFLLGAVIGILAGLALMAVVILSGFIGALGQVDSMAHSAWQKIRDLNAAIDYLKSAVANPIAILIAITAKLNAKDNSGGGGGNNPGGHPVFVPGAGAGGGGGELISMDVGGIVPGPVGAPMLAIVHGGEMVIPPGRGGVAGHVVTFNIYGVSDPQAVAAEVDRRMAYLLTLS